MNLKRYGQLILDLFAIVPYIETQKPNEYSSSILCCLQSHAREAHDQARMPESERKNVSGLTGNMNDTWEEHLCNLLNVFDPGALNRLKIYV